MGEFLLTPSLGRTLLTCVQLVILTRVFAHNTTDTDNFEQGQSEPQTRRPSERTRSCDHSPNAPRSH